MRNETNLGANANYRKCLTFVENELVTVTGADDVMLPNYVQWFVDAAAKHPEASIFQPPAWSSSTSTTACRTPWWSSDLAFYRPKGEAAEGRRAGRPAAARRVVLLPVPAGVRTPSWAPASVRA